MGKPENKGFLLYFLIGMVMIILAGCTQRVGVSSDQAVTARFVEFAPTSSEIDTYQPGEEIDVAIELTNMLPEDIEAGKVKVRLTGDAAISTVFQGAKIVENPLLEAYNYETNTKSPEEVNLGPIKYVGGLSTKTSKEITAKYCYEIPIKLKGNLFYTADEVEIGTNYVIDQTHPSSVTITEISQEPVKVNKETNKGILRFKITIANQGKGVVINSIDDCFKYRTKSEREELKAEVQAAYPVSCENEGYLRLSRDTKTKILDCQVSDIDATNLGPQPSELTVTLTDFAYEDTIEPVTIWLEP